MSTKKDLSRVLKEDLGPLTFGSFLRGARTFKDKTQVEMAGLLGISKSTLCDMEKGRQIVSPELAARIARQCELSEVLAVETALMDQLRRAKLDMRVRIQSGSDADTGSPKPRSAKVKPRTKLAARRGGIRPRTR